VASFFVHYLNRGKLPSYIPHALSSAVPCLLTQFITSSEPVTLGEYALALVAFTYLAPVLLGAFRSVLRIAVLGVPYVLLITG